MSEITEMGTDSDGSQPDENERQKNNHNAHFLSLGVAVSKSANST